MSYSRFISRRGHCLATAMLLMLVAFPAWAIDITVDLLGDPAPDGCTPGHCSLREAIMLANSLPGPDRIFLPATPSVPLQLTIPGDNENANATGDLDILDDLEIIGTGVATTRLVQTVQDRVMQATMGSSKRLVLRGLTIQGGRGIQGGALQAASLLTIEDVAFIGNTVNSSSGMPQGGAIYFTASYAPTITEPRLVLRRVRFENNTATTTAQAEALGGALHAWSFFNGAPFVLIEDCDFIGNESTMGGGAVYFSGSPNNFGGNVDIRRSRFSDNRTGRNGGAAIHASLFSSFVLRIEDSLFDANVATGTDSAMAGAIYLGQVSSAVLLRTTLASNQGNRGGALLSYALRTELIDSHLFDNIAARGGGALWASRELLVERSTFESNRITSTDAADPGGGAIAFSGTALAIDRSTLSGNDAYRGGAISMGAGLMQLYRSTIIAPTVGIAGRQGTAIRMLDNASLNTLAIANSILSGSCLFASPDFRWAQAYNTIEAPGNGCRLTTGIVNAQNQVSATTAQINLGPLADNGGPTPTRLPGTGSIAINQGRESHCSAADQRYYLRADAFCDIGAIEVGATSALPGALFHDGFE